MHGNDNEQMGMKLNYVLCPGWCVILAAPPLVRKLRYGCLLYLNTDCQRFPVIPMWKDGTKNKARSRLLQIRSPSDGHILCRQSSAASSGGTSNPATLVAASKINFRSLNERPNPQSPLPPRRSERSDEFAERENSSERKSGGKPCAHKR